MHSHKKKILKTTLSFKYALEGIVYAFRTQKNLRIHIFVAFIIIFLSFLVKCSPLEIAVIVLTIGLVISLELLNTAIEATIDIVSPENRPIAKIAKDLAAASVLIAAISSVIIGLIILEPRLIQSIRSLN